VSLETGYNRLWVMSRIYEALSEWNDIYDPDNSTTSVDNNEHDHGYAGVNELGGEKYTDEIYYFFQTFNQTFNTIEHIYTQDGYDPLLYFSGVLGLAWDVKEVTKPLDANSSPLLNICEHMNVSKVFSIWQERDAYPGGDFISQAQMSYGTTNPGYCDDDIVYFPVRGSYENVLLVFDLSAFKFGDYSKNAEWTGQLDTGSSIIYVPTTISEKIYRIIRPTFASELYLYTTDCAQASTLADWIFTVGGRQWNLPASQYLIDIGLPGGQCVAAFDSSPAFTDFIFGQPMLRQYCSIYDAENNQVGLSTAIHASPKTTPRPTPQSSN